MFYSFKRQFVWYSLLACADTSGCPWHRLLQPAAIFAKLMGRDSFPAFQTTRPPQNISHTTALVIMALRSIFWQQCECQGRGLLVCFHIVCQLWVGLFRSNPPQLIFPKHSPFLSCCIGCEALQRVSGSFWRVCQGLKRAADILCKGGLEELFWENRERSRVSSCFGLPHARW